MIDEMNKFFSWVFDDAPGFVGAFMVGLLLVSGFILTLIWLALIIHLPAIGLTLPFLGIFLIWLMYRAHRK